MLVVSKKYKNIPLIIVGVVFCIFVVNHLRLRAKNNHDMSNILGIAGISGAKVYAIEPTPDLLMEIEKAKSNPSEIVDPLARILDNKMSEFANIKKEFKDKNSPEYKFAFESSYAYAIRIILLKKWKPGMTREEIIKKYLEQTNRLQFTYDFKSHPDEFLGFN
jgi:hypothetical protein